MKERVISLSILVFAMVYLAGSISLSVGTLDKPGPGFVPAGVAIGLLVVAGINVYKAFRASAEPTEQDSWLKVAPIGIAIILFVYPIMLRPLNFIIATFVVLFALLRLLKFKSLVVSLLTALFTTFFSFYLFSNVLGVVLPSGFIEDIILRL
ncbi:MAG: tripartite tricarboxylate transporter TctB family protein [Desulfitobacterium hafniense]|nr:tripartite tricarboxylate transporter TctB family protein [Desulfitobacterium hafniense]